MSERDGRRETIAGVVTARTCDCCGHHEIGMMTQNGEYVRLKPGMKITIFVNDKDQNRLKKLGNKSCE